MKKTTSLDVRVDAEVKERAEEVFSRLGLSSSAAFNLFLDQVSQREDVLFEVVQLLVPPNQKTREEIDQLLKESEQKILEDHEAGRCRPAEELFAELDAKLAEAKAKLTDLNLQVDTELKERAEKIFSQHEMGIFGYEMEIPDAACLFLGQVSEKGGLPFGMTLPPGPPSAGAE